MRNLDHLPDPSFPYFTAIVAAKDNPRRQRLEGIAPDIQQAYEGYANSLQNLQHLQGVNLAEELQNDLKHCYTVSTNPREQLLNAITNHHRANNAAVAAFCQYCGLNHDACQFDHYLPQEEFAEYATLSLNLVPCCGCCNQLKGTKWLDNNGARKIVSIYHDDLPETQYLFADIEMGVVPLAHFRLSDNPDVYGGLEQTIRNHFQELDLLNRFFKAAPALYSEIGDDILPFARLGNFDGASALLLNKSARLALNYSPNYWKVALFQAIAASREFIQMGV